MERNFEHQTLGSHLIYDSPRIARRQQQLFYEGQLPTGRRAVKMFRIKLLIHTFFYTQMMAYASQRGRSTLANQIFIFISWLTNKNFNFIIYNFIILFNQATRQDVDVYYPYIYVNIYFYYLIFLMHFARDKHNIFRSEFQ